MNKRGFVYILTNQNQTVLYIGVTSNLKQRIYQHKNMLIEGFSKKYRTHKLVYYEIAENIEFAILREKQLKRWHKDWKINLIKQSNPDLDDLYDSL
ncbi:GIY-YIG nuclease family protein [Francisella sp. LA112445]|jgi:putative endonuclease|uniref:GIY-YIG nuclease family protein n=1 Tax=Francisella sp. LA112445 TaxID=1395624 RepID=UPI001788DD70|nr:GIY-YIG nuclease family protein [Francisella sp. LA112445]QIW10079.1 GIY-YIG nuclease family protein [Francisella sp. LA112445]